MTSVGNFSSFLLSQELQDYYAGRGGAGGWVWGVGEVGAGVRFSVLPGS